MVKDEDTLRERYPFSRFKEVALEMVAKWSNEYSTNMKKYSQEPTITLNLWTKGYQWARTNKSISSKRIGESTEYYLPANDEIKTTQTEIDYIKEMRWKTFDQFKRKAFKVWTLTMINNEEKWSHNVCSCPDFFKKFMCKHCWFCNSNEVL